MAIRSICVCIAAILVAFALFVSPAVAQTVTVSLFSPQAGTSVGPGSTIEWRIEASVSGHDNAGLGLISLGLQQAAGNPERFDIPYASGVPLGMENFSRPLGISNPGDGGMPTGYVGHQSGVVGQKNLIQIGGGQNIFGEARSGAMGTSANVVAGVGQSGAQIIAEGSFAAPATYGTYQFSLTDVKVNVLQHLNPPPAPPKQWPVVAVQEIVLSPGSLSFTVSDVITCTQGDMNNDGDVNGLDIQSFMATMINPAGATQTQQCAADMNEDGLYDCVDTLLFNGVLLGIEPGACMPCDVNGDGLVNGDDISPFVEVLVAPCNANAAAYCAADCDGNGAIEPADVNAFVDALVGAGG